MYPVRIESVAHPSWFKGTKTEKIKDVLSLLRIGLKLKLEHDTFRGEKIERTKDKWRTLVDLDSKTQDLKYLKSTCVHPKKK